MNDLITKNKTLKGIIALLSIALLLTGIFSNYTTIRTWYDKRKPS